MRRILPCIILLLVCALSTSAQDDPEYKLEVGAGVGMVNYLGDFNASLTGELQPSGSLIAKYRPNPRMAWAATISYGQLKSGNQDLVSVAAADNRPREAAGEGRLLVVQQLADRRGAEI